MADRAKRKLPSRPMGAALIEDVQFLLGNGIHRERIVQQVGRNSVDSLVRTLQRYGEHELASKLQYDPAAEHREPGPLTRREARSRNASNG
jgi:hypothetical protein